MLNAIAVAALACALIALVGGRARHPAWIGFAVVAVLAWMGAG